MKPRVVIWCLKNGSFELVGIGHCASGQNALYGVYDNIEKCYSEAWIKYIDYNDEQYNPKNIEVKNIHYLRKEKIKKINNKIHEKKQR